MTLPASLETRQNQSRQVHIFMSSNVSTAFNNILWSTILSVPLKNNILKTLPFFIKSFLTDSITTDYNDKDTKTIKNNL